MGGVKSEYIWDGTQLAGQKNGIILFLYEGTGLSGFQKDGVNYYYLRNGQNDIIGILDVSGNRVVSYTYDAWGKVLTTTMASTLGAQNPFRYRGYYYDSESGLYYLQSRYYDPNTGRFLNADGQLNPDTGHNGMNLFAYCNNNQVNAADPDGHRMLAYNGTSSVVVSAAVLAAALAAAAAASSQAPVYLPYGGTVNKQSGRDFCCAKKCDLCSVRSNKRCVYCKGKAIN